MFIEILKIRKSCRYPKQTLFTHVNLLIVPIGAQYPPVASYELLPLDSLRVYLGN